MMDNVNCSLVEKLDELEKKSLRFRKKHYNKKDLLSTRF